MTSFVETSSLGLALGLKRDPAELAPLLDEHHLVMLGERAADREAFVIAVTERLATLPDTEVVRLRGSKIGDLDAFCRQLEREAHTAANRSRDAGDSRTARPRRPRRTIGGVVELLESWPSTPKRLYLVWSDADVLLESNVALFGRLANALLSVAAVREHTCPDVLVIQRVVFTGGDKLGAYFEEEHGQLRSWLVDSQHDPFAEVHTYVKRPPVLAYRLDG